MSKLMAVKPLTGDFLSLQAFQEAQNNYFFLEQNDPNACYVYPYTLVTDGRDILISENENEKVEAGWLCQVEKPGWNLLGSKASPAEFDKIVESTAKDNFINFWKAIRTLKSPPKQIKYKKDRIEKIGVEYTDFDNDCMSIHVTNRGTYNITKKKFLPIYFLIVSNIRLVNFIPHDDKKPCIPVEFKWFVRNHKSLMITLETQNVMEMIVRGDIMLPVISQNPTWPEEK